MLAQASALDMSSYIAGYRTMIVSQSWGPARLTESTIFKQRIRKGGRV
jgi:hypothetical protein